MIMKNKVNIKDFMLRTRMSKEDKAKLEQIMRLAQYHNV